VVDIVNVWLNRILGTSSDCGADSLKPYGESNHDINRFANGFKALRYPLQPCVV